jgi:hypothetical protein
MLDYVDTFPRRHIGPSSRDLEHMLQAVGATSLDDLIDRTEDEAAGAHNYLTYYGGSEDAANRLDLIAQLAGTAIAPLRHRRRHAAILAGVVGFYLSAPEAKAPYARPARERLLRSVGPAVRPIVAFMRRRRKRPEGTGMASGS